jgi:hypothetical protein
MPPNHSAQRDRVGQRSSQKSHPEPLSERLGDLVILSLAPSLVWSLAGGF